MMMKERRIKKIKFRILFQRFYLCYNLIFKKKAFSLVELSIVLSVMAILIVVVVSGGALIRNAKVASFMSEVLKYRVNISRFYDTYDSLPGDMYDASDVFTNVALNGNGNGRVDMIVKDLVYYAENHLAWHHLGESGILDRKYSGTPSGTISYDPAFLRNIISNVSSNVSALGLNIPKIKNEFDIELGISLTNYYDNILDNKIHLVIAGESTQYNDGEIAQGGLSDDIVSIIKNKYDSHSQINEGYIIPNNGRNNDGTNQSCVYIEQNDHVMRYYNLKTPECVLYLSLIHI